MHWLTKATPFADQELSLNWDILWVTVLFGALALIFAIVSIIVTFWLSYRERNDRYRQSILANIEFLLKSLKLSFDDIGQSLFYRNTLGLERAIDSFDIYSTLTLDELNPKIFFSSHHKIEDSVYRKIMEDMMKNSIPIGIDRYTAILTMSRKKLADHQKHYDSGTIARLNGYLKTYEKKLAEKKQLAINLKAHPKELWNFTQKELTDFRNMLEAIWADIVDGYRQYKPQLKEKTSVAWKKMDDLYGEYEDRFYQFRGTLQSLFLD